MSSLISEDLPHQNGRGLKDHASVKLDLICRFASSRRFDAADQEHGRGTFFSQLPPFSTLNRRQEAGLMRMATPKVLMITAILLVTAQIARAEITWESDLRTAHEKAVAEDKLLLLHFYSDNCIWCDRLEAGAFQESSVGKAISANYVALKVHARKSPKLTGLFKVTKFPTDVVVTTAGQILTHRVSPQQPERYVAMLAGCVASKPVAQVAEKTEREPIGNKSTQQNAAKPDPSVPATPNNEISRSSQPQSNSGVPARFAGSRGPRTNEPVVPSDNFNQLPAAEFTPTEKPAAGLNMALPESQPEPINPTSPASPAPAATAPETASADVPTAIIKPDLAMQGFCAVTVVKENQWVEGKSEYGVIHLGKLYLFSSQQAMGTFLADPAPYTPILNEIDVVRFFEERKIVKGKREFGVLDPIHNRMFFFADEAALKHFENEYERYTDAAIEVMETAIKEANPEG